MESERPYFLMHDLLDLTDLIGSTKMLELFHRMLCDPEIEQHDWRYYESVLFCLLELSEHEAFTDNAKLLYIPQILSKMMNLKAIRHEHVRLNATRCFGRFCGSLPANDHVLKLCFNAFVVGGLVEAHSPQIRDAAVHCWRLFCHHFKGHQLPPTFMQSMYNIYVGCLNKKNSKTSKYTLSNGHILSIMEGLMTIFTAFTNLRETKTSVAYLMKIPYRALRSLTTVTAADMSS